MIYTINNNKTTRSDIIELNYDKGKDFYKLNYILHNLVFVCHTSSGYPIFLHETYFWDKLDNYC